MRLGRIYQAGTRQGRHRGRNPEPRSRRLAEEHLHRLGLQPHQHLLAQLLRSLDRRAAHLRLEPHPEGRDLHQLDGLRQPARRRALREGGARERWPGARASSLDEMQSILHDDLPVIFLMEMSYTHVWNKRVHGLITNGISMYSNWDARLDGLMRALAGRDRAMQTAPLHRAARRAGDPERARHRDPELRAAAPWRRAMRPRSSRRRSGGATPGIRRGAAPRVRPRPAALAAISRLSRASCSTFDLGISNVQQRPVLALIVDACRRRCS